MYSHTVVYCILSGGWSMVPFTGVTAIVLVFTFLYVKETKGKSLEEIQEEMCKAA